LKDAAVKGFDDAKKIYDQSVKDEGTYQKDLDAKKKARDDSDRKVTDAARAKLTKDFQAASAKKNESKGDWDTFKETIKGAGKADTWAAADYTALSAANKTKYDNFKKNFDEATTKLGTAQKNMDKDNEAKLAKDKEAAKAKRTTVLAAKEVTRKQDLDKINVAK
jgi:hypothetical protein